MVNAQEWLNNQYPLEERKNVKNLEISSKELEEELDLGDFTELEELNCSYNELTNLKIAECPKLTKLNCSYNLLNEIEFLSKLPHPEKLLFLNIDNGCLKFFSREEIKEKTQHFKNLVKLTPDLEKYKEEKKRSESYDEILRGATKDAVQFAKKKYQEQILLREIEKEKQEAKNIEKSLKESKIKDQEQENRLEEIRNSLGSMNKATIIIIDSDDPDQIVIRLSSESKEEINDEEIRTDSEDQITLNVKVQVHLRFPAYCLEQSKPLRAGKQM